MKCPNCGKEIPDEAKFCNKCGTQISSQNDSVGKKPFIWKDQYTYISIAGAIVLAAVIGLIVKFSKSTEDNLNPQIAVGNRNGYSENDEKKGYDFQEDEEYYDDVNNSNDVDGSDKEENLTADEIDVESQVLAIREEYNSVVKNINNGDYSKKVTNNGISVYTDGVSIKAIVVPKKSSGNEYSKFYYYNDDGELFFAYYEAEDANRFYFSEEKMVRWRYSQSASNAQDAVNHDLEENSEYDNWEKSVLQDGYHYLGLEMSAEDDDYILPGSDSIYLEMSDLAGLSAEECRLARNELYARHGRCFDDEALQAYFDNKDWYKGTIAPSDFKEDTLNDYEVHNRDLIVQYEQEKGFR